jgi:hypothetical protein
MKLAIMQPYAFPYLGYFQLIKAVDRFILLDDVDFIKRSWINRNTLADKHGPRKFTIPVNTPKRGQLISAVRLHDARLHQRRLLKTIYHFYHRAPFFPLVFPVVEHAVHYDGEDLTAYLHHTLAVLNDYLGIKTPLFRSSELHERKDKRGQERIIEICHAQGATLYINPEGGMHVYENHAFEAAGIQLTFLIHIPRSYRHPGNVFIPRLSIIDAMMFNNRDELDSLLEEYRLVPHVVK